MSAAPPLEKTRARLQALGQEHLLHFAPTLSPSALRSLLEQIAALPLEELPGMIAETEAQARQCLALLSGRRHRVYGSIVVQAPRGVIRQRTVVTFVKMKRLTDAELEAYIASGEWQGKAGGYAIQGQAAAFITEINGSYTNVVGLCLPTTVKLLAEFR